MKRRIWVKSWDRKRWTLAALLLGFGLSPVEPAASPAATNMTCAIAIHGGAGNLRPGSLSSELETACRRTLREALMTGHQILTHGGTSLDAVERTIRVLEDSPLFNAGKGAVFTSAGANELDASIMDGRTLGAGAVAGVSQIKNPISLARLVMERSPHVMLAGEGAEAFAREQGVEMTPPEYFRTERSWQRLQQAKEREAAGAQPPPADPEDKHGTVGVVALDRHGNLAAGTSTGGMTNKRPGRIGDSPVIGAGTYADNRTCAVSATGHGEYFIRLAVAHDISALMAYRGLSVREAAERVIGEKLARLGGTGGVIALDRQGNVATPFNTPGMFRAWINSKGEPEVRLYGVSDES